MRVLVAAGAVLGGLLGLGGACAAAPVGGPGDASAGPVAAVRTPVVGPVVRPIRLAAHAETTPGSTGPGTAAVRDGSGVLAQGAAAPGGSSGEINAVLDRLRQAVVWIATAAASVVLAIGGLRYLLANGDIGEVDAAKRAFKGAAVGYAIAALAQVLASVLFSIVDGPQ